MGAGCDRAWQWAGGADDHMITMCPNSPSEHDVMGAGCDRARQWAGGVDDHLNEVSDLCNFMLFF